MQQNYFYSNNKLIVKRNELINSRFNLTIPELRLFLLAVAQIEKTDKEFKVYNVKISDIVNCAASKHKGYNIEQIRKVAISLREKTILIPKKDGDELVSGFVTSIELKKKTGLAEVLFDPKLKPFLIELKDGLGFTSYGIHNVLKLRSLYSFRIYELLKQFELIGTRTFQIDELKNILSYTSIHNRYSDFKTTVLIKTQEELNKYCDISFDYEEVKYSRKVTAIKFKIKKAIRNGSKIIINCDNDKPNNKEDDLFLALKEIGISDNQANNFMDNKKHSGLWEKIKYVNDKFETNKIKNPAAYLTRLIKDDAEIIAPIKKKKEKKCQINFQAQKQIRVLEKTLSDFNERYINKKKLIIKKFLNNNETLVGEEIKQKCKEINPLVFRKYLHQKSLLENMNRYKTLESLIISGVEKLYPDEFEKLNQKALPYIKSTNRKIADLRNGH